MIDIWRLFHHHIVMNWLASTPGRKICSFPPEYGDQRLSLNGNVLDDKKPEPLLFSFDLRNERIKHILYYVDLYGSDA